ncbi:Fc.00g024420.m01.CDS01 [Cosmosporella sp. VM-42]
MSQFGPQVGATRYRPWDLVVPAFLSDTPGTRQELTSYAEAISSLDQGVGMILKELTNASLDNNTLVIFMSDNGPHFMNSKTTLCGAGICLPLIIRHPGKASLVNPNHGPYVDILPTIFDWTAGPASLSETKHSGRCFLEIIDATERLQEWDHVFGPYTFHESTSYWPTRYIRNTS